MSFNNWLDVYAAHSLVTGLASPAAVIVKHNNPSGAAVTASLAKAYELAFECDTVSAFGGIVAFNQEAGEDAASAMGEVFTEVVVAPGFTDAALDAFGARRNLRVVQVPEPVGGGLDIRPLPGGALVQDRDVANETRDRMEVVSAREPSAAEWRDLAIAWTVAAHVKSNAIVFAKDGATDAFFPFPDALEVAAQAGVTAVIHPGGSVRDEDVLAAAEARGMAVVVTGRRHFRH